MRLLNCGVIALSSAMSSTYWDSAEGTRIVSKKLWGPKPLHPGYAVPNNIRFREGEPSWFSF